MLGLISIGFVEITWIDIVDVIIVSFVLYKLYQIVRRTIALQVILGLLLILALYFVTEATNLRSLNWIIDSLSDIWLIAFIILFQPELRRLLLTLIKTPLLDFFTSSTVESTVDEVVVAVTEMARSRTGALVVLGKGRDIAAVNESGIPLNARVSRELLLSIFNEKSPLHDGAIVIQEGVVERARCILPLSTTTSYREKDLGTRHRAALGLSEQDDVIVIVVSEETGKISVAEDGIFYLDLELNELERLLHQKLATANNSKSKQPFLDFSARK